MAIDRVGQKVVCLVDLVAVFTVSESVTGPKKGCVYTVDGFGIVSRTLPVPGIYLREVEVPRCPCGCGALTAWPINCFRPFDERKTDISGFVGLGVEAKEPV